MGKEALIFPESSLEQVIRIIRRGLFQCEGDPKVSDSTRAELRHWCDVQQRHVEHPENC